MSNEKIREQFEEIWPVPEGVYWMPLSRSGGEYMADPRLKDDALAEARHYAAEHDARLDTFNRCQESIFSKEELNLFRQWFNAMEDLTPTYIEKSDCDLYSKVMEMLK